MENIKKYFIELKGIKDKKKIYEVLAAAQDLTSDEKNLIYFTKLPRPLLDMELPSRIMKYRGQENQKGFLTPNTQEIGLLLEALRTAQYSRFMFHNLHAFLGDGVEIFPVSGNEECECSLCRKKTYPYEKWAELCNQYPGTGEEENKEYLAFGSDHTKLTICLDCLVQLRSLHEFLKTVEGENYLDYKQRNKIILDSF